MSTSRSEQLKRTVDELERKKQKDIKAATDDLGCLVVLGIPAVAAVLLSLMLKKS